MATAATAASPVAAALRVAGGVGLSFVLAAWWQLPHAGLAVWTTFMVMAAPPTTVFQRGVERILGRCLGVVLGVVVSALFADWPYVLLLFEAACLLPLFYLYFAGRLAYTFLNAGLYLAAVVEIARATPAAVGLQGVGLLAAVVLGSVVADLVVWLSGGERDLRVDPGTAPLWPLRADWVNHTLMLVVTTLLTQRLLHWLGVPAEKAIISVMVLAACPDIQSLLHKGELRLTGAVFGAAWGLAGFALVSRLPFFALLLLVVVLAAFVATYVARTGGPNSYVGVQMGLVVPLLLVVPPSEFGDPTAVLQRIEGIVIALGTSVLVAGVWPRFPARPAA